MPEIACVLIVDGQEEELMLADDLLAIELVDSIVERLELPRTDGSDRYVYTLRDPVSRVPVLSTSETLAQSGAKEGARFRLHRTVAPKLAEFQADAEQMAEAVPAAVPLEETETADVDAGEIRGQGQLETAPATVSEEAAPAPETEPAELALLSFTVLVEGRESAVTFQENAGSREVVREIVEQFELPTGEDRQAVVYTLEHPRESELVLRESETLAEAGVSSDSRLRLFKVLQPNLVNVTLVNEQQELPASLPVDQPAAELLAQLTTNLPTHERGHRIVYLLEHPSEDRLHLAAEETLEQAAVEPGARLRLLRLLYPPEPQSGTTIGRIDRSSRGSVPESSRAAPESVPDGAAGERRPQATRDLLRYLRTDPRPYVAALAAAVALAAVFFATATDGELFGLASPSLLDLLLEVDAEASVRGEDALYLTYLWALLPLSSPAGPCC